MKVLIKKGSVSCELDRKDLIEVSETHDGVVFNFKNGMHLYVVDPGMSPTTKGLIRAADGFPKGNIEFDLQNYNRPATVELI